jgi:pre-rRNA-processing protein IPI1
LQKYKHKVGRKLPPPKNATNTEIKSKSKASGGNPLFFPSFSCLGREFVLCARPAIVLPEQSMASERAGMAVNKRGLTLRELLQQTAHYNANVRRGELPLVCTVTHQIN